MRENAALKLIPYGNSGFRCIRCDGFAYADKTRFIETLERSGDRFMLIVRPRRFGKTLFTETLHAYYDRSQAPLFEKSFSGTYIGSHRTPLASQFYVLKFIFAGISRENPEGSFLQCVRSALVNFFNYYPHPREQVILGATFQNAADLIEAFFSILGPDFCQKVFVIIDEYDHLTNAVLSREIEEFKQITSTAGFFKDFYTKLKSATSDTGPVARIYVTGVTSIALDSMTSGFSIAKNFTTRSEFATLCGFTEAELRQLIPQVIDLQKYRHSLDEIVSRMREWYNGYRFSARTTEAVFNASMCLYYLDAIRDENDEPDTMLDPSFAQDLQKISGILSLGDPDFVKGVVEKALQHEPIDFPSASLQLLNVNRDDRFNADCVLSAMFYMGYLTFAPNDRHKLVVPNRAVGIQFFEYYLQYILSLTGEASSYSARDLTVAYRALEGGDLEPLFRSASTRFAEQSDAMAAVHLSESDFQTLIAASLYFDSDVEVVREAQAVGPEGGRIDLLIRPVKGSPVKTTYLVEFKHLSKAEGKSEAAIQKRLGCALEQTRRYARCANIRGIPNLKRVAVVYAGTELVRLVQEEGEAGA